MDNNRKKILIVEDDEILAEDLKESISSMGFIVTAYVASGEDAIAQIKINQPDLILMDIRLKGYLDGFQTAEEITAVQDLPIIYISGLPYEDKLYRSKLNVPYGYLTKPFTSGELQIAIESALNNWYFISN
jgi:CheY-like chemotaxis protein